jgi:Adenylate and Guanylate cyclase catalytic domain
VTILFADVEGSLELLVDRDAEEASLLLDAVLALMMDAVHRYGGTVNHALGDGIMAIFGAPIAHEDHAVRACYAALQIQDAIGRHARATAWTSLRGSASTPAKSSCARSPATSSSTTARSGARPIWLGAWNRWPGPAPRC